MNLFQPRSGVEHNLPQMMTRYRAWANELMFETVSTIPHDELVKERPTTFKTIIRTLNHIYVVDDIFRAHLEGRTHGYAARNTETTPPLADLRRAMNAMDEWYVGLADRLNQDQLSESIDFEFVGGGAGRMTRLEIILHVVNHATYHSGFVSDMLYQVPVTPSANDLPVFLRDVWNAPR